MSVNNKLAAHLSLLGYPARDKVTGFKGVITSVSFDLYGCIQYDVTPKKEKDKDVLSRGYWFDVSRIEIRGEKVMEMPDYTDPQIANGDKGASPKSSR